MLCYAVSQQDWTRMWYTNMVEAFVWEQEKTFNELLKAGQGEWWWGGGGWEGIREARYPTPL